MKQLQTGSIRWRFVRSFSGILITGMGRKIMDVRKVRSEMGMGRSFYDLPLRVTFYARVSTDMDAQLNSLENQIRYYTEFIQSKPNWTYVPGYVDEGISGGTTKKRDDFNRMIRDAKAGLFDFIITKEISRFSRSTLDSIKYTQELLDHNVGVFFQNDHINTLDLDSEFRLVVMAGVAQDELRKLSERTKFGFAQSIKNGRVLGNDKLYGYDKKNCVMTVNEGEAEIVRTVFDLYANHGMGTRKISRTLTEMGYTSRQGNAFNTLTIRNMLENPKYKGWYCGRKTQSLDYRTKKKAFLEESEWVMYPDPAIPAIVSEELWNRANSIYRERSKQMKAHTNGASYHNRYPYSGKIICQVHSATFHRQLLESRKGKQEVWQCKVYRQKGRAACSAPQLRSEDLDLIMAQIFMQMVKDKNTIIDAVIDVLKSTLQEADCSKAKLRLEEEVKTIHAKKDRLLELSIADALTVPEFKKRNGIFNQQLEKLEAQLAAVEAQETQQKNAAPDWETIRRELEKELTFQEKINTALVATILEKIAVKQESSKNEIHLDIYLKLGQKYEAVYSPQKISASVTSSRNTTPRPLIRRI
jgi:DNA invertase Pin-like site-specific DNA recombinase